MPLPAVIAAILTFGCASSASAETSGERDWHYRDGETAENWSAANPRYAMCDRGTMQSPIDLSAVATRGTARFAAAYGPAIAKLTVGPGKVKVAADEGMGLIHGGRLFPLRQVHFHTPAEHKTHGKLYPLAAHFVHATDDGELTVLGVTFEAGAANPALQTILDAATNGADNVELDFAQLAPRDPAVYRYMGSLTTPPCSEGVNWFVADTVMTASQEQIAAMTDRLGTSNRSLQPLNGRLVLAPEN
ncbi:carbonic anhydrase family protein [Altererythrobacter sp. FM1]|uniref:carbonic anhydrase n=1 Tax=Tsuneonella flava TaxID=2055955 RepID=UPI000C80AFBA|nr:carbonic anhydrase family protein [Tsuneonella flava]ROT94934.1 carbonic anhydrase family protein [Altererythrobacter sp. FM1]